MKIIILEYSVSSIFQNYCYLITFTGRHWTWMQIAVWISHSCSVTFYSLGRIPLGENCFIDNSFITDSAQQ